MQEFRGNRPASQQMTTMAGRIAILVPCRNAGALLSETIESAAGSNLPPNEYAWLISDNASEDGSTSSLPDRDANGAPIILSRNGSDLGRVENWNCAFRAAEELGFSFAFFLMSGDLLNGDGLIGLRAQMDRSGGFLGLGSYDVVDSKLRYVRTARRIAWKDNTENVIGPAAFIAQSLAVGGMLFGPLGANLYRLDRAIRLRFDPSDPTHTDQAATACFACAAARPIVYTDHVLSRWRTRPGRFHATMNYRNRLEGDMRTIEACCRLAGVPPDRDRIAATFVLRALSQSAFRSSASTRHLSGQYGRFTLSSYIWAAKLLWRRMRYGTPWLITT